MARTTTLAKVSSQVAAQQPQQPLSTAVRGIVSKVLTGKKADDFVTSVVSLVNQNPDLALCDRTSLAASALQAQSLNLSLNKSLGQAWIVPFDDKKHGRKMATFQIGYKGYIQLAIRSGQYRKLNVIPIKEGELISFDPLNEDLEVELIQNEVERQETPTIGYYAMFEYLNGFRKAVYWSKEKMEAHAQKYSPAYITDLKNGWTNSFWSKDFDAMACKTMLRHIISKWGIMSVELQKALVSDECLAKDIGVFGDIVGADDLPTETPVIDAESETSKAEAVKQAPEKKDARKTVKKPEIVDSFESPEKSPGKAPEEFESPWPDEGNDDSFYARADKAAEDAGLQG